MQCKLPAGRYVEMYQLEKNERPALCCCLLQLVLKANHFNTIRVGITSMKKKTQEANRRANVKKIEDLPLCSPFTNDNKSSTKKCQEV